MGRRGSGARGISAAPTVPLSRRASSLPDSSRGADARRRLTRALHRHLPPLAAGRQMAITETSDVREGGRKKEVAIAREAGTLSGDP